MFITIARAFCLCHNLSYSTGWCPWYIVKAYGQWIWKDDAVWNNIYQHLAPLKSCLLQAKSYRPLLSIHIPWDTLTLAECFSSSFQISVWKVAYLCLNTCFNTSGYWRESNRRVWKAKHQKYILQTNTFQRWFRPKTGVNAPLVCWAMEGDVSVNVHWQSRLLLQMDIIEKGIEMHMDT